MTPSQTATCTAFQLIQPQNLLWFFRRIKLCYRRQRNGKFNNIKKERRKKHTGHASQDGRHDALMKVKGKHGEKQDDKAQ